MEPTNLPPHARLTWLVGPPGAGKTTFAMTGRHGFLRVVELNAMLQPLVSPVAITKGVLAANGMLITLIRHIEFHPDNVCLAPILVVAGLVEESALLPVRDDETVWLLHPCYDRWREQLYCRPAKEKRNPQYSDYDYAELWYNRFNLWHNKSRVHVIDTQWEPERIGSLPPLSRVDTFARPSGESVK